MNDGILIVIRHFFAITDTKFAVAPHKILTSLLYVCDL